MGKGKPDNVKEVFLKIVEIAKLFIVLQSAKVIDSWPRIKEIACDFLPL